MPLGYGALVPIGDATEIKSTDCIAKVRSKLRLWKKMEFHFFSILEME